MLNSKINKNSSIGLVVIGRNEGQRLFLSLQSMQSSHCPIVYVDSGSSDNSVEIARPLVSCLHQLDPAKPFSAARARNEGFEQLTNLFPDLQYIQFVDGDCVICDGWLEAAQTAMQQDTKRAAIIGHLQELNPGASVYNRMCAMEWRSPAGDLTNFGALGGISMIRADVFKQLGGFKANVIAGEDSEFGVRLSLAGYKVTKIDHFMAIHDANMTTFQQWWKRAVRGGHAIGQRADLNGNTLAKDCIKERKSTLVWGVLLPILALFLLIIAGRWSLLVLFAYLFLAIKVYFYRRNQGENYRDAFTYAQFMPFVKIANGLGLLKFYVNKFKHSYEIIEYK
jgi:GT2 family glycosyltransferase